MSLVLCFPGQGSQEVGMGRAFAESVPSAAQVFDEASTASGLDLERLCFEGPIEELTRTEVQQPALVTASLACLAAVSETLARGGVEPAFVVGHSVGEYTALAACGAFGTADAVALVRERGVATAATADETPGVMAAVIGLDDAEVEELCAGTDGVWPANFNCPGQVVVSGTRSAVQSLTALATARGARRVIELRVTGAFHCPLMAAAVPRLEPAVARVAWQEPRIPFMSTVTAAPEPRKRLGALLLEQLTAPVRFTQAVRALAAAGADLFVEVGPGQVLAGLVRRIDPGVTALSVGDPPSLAKLEEVLGS